MFNSINLYRIERKLYLYKIPVLPKIIKLIIFLVYNSIIPYECEIGSNTKFGYGGMGVVIHKKAKIGDRCMIAQQVTIGGKQRCDKLPVIGNDVEICAGAKIIGNVTIGNNVVIGVNAVVNKDVPDNAVVAGVPAKIIRIKN